MLLDELRFQRANSKVWNAEKEPGSSVRIVSDYGLDDQAIGVRSPAGANDFSSNPFVQTGSEAQPPVLWVPGVFPGAKCGRGVTLTTHSSSAEVKNE
jgi:hypothetical protein